MNFQNRADGGAYQEFHSSRQSLNRGLMGNEQIAGGDAANSSAYNRDHSRSFLSDAAEEMVRLQLNLRVLDAFTSVFGRVPAKFVRGFS